MPKIRIRIPAPEDIQANNALIASVIGGLYCVGALLVGGFLLLPDPAGVRSGPLVALAVLSVAIGALLFATASRLSTPWLHAAIGAASAIVCAGIYFAGQPSLAGPLFVWIVLITAFFFPGRPAAAQMIWLFALYGVVVFSVHGTVIPPITRLLLNTIAFGTICAVVSWLSSGSNRRLQTSFEEARTDALTGLPNRRWLGTELAREFGWARRHQGRLFVAIIDIDDFKSYNDREGHLAGDELLIAAVSAWSTALRASDFLARTGGDEFMLLLPDSTERRALGVVERLRASTPEGVTCSVGLTMWDGEEESLELFARADAGLYGAKHGGGDRTATSKADSEIGRDGRTPAPPESKQPDLEPADRAGPHLRVR